MLPEYDSLIDFEMHCLSPSEVRSAAAMAAYWRPAAFHALCEVVLPDDKDFHDTLLDLPGSLGDMAWQRKWLRHWERLTDAGVAVGELFRLVFLATREAEQKMLGGTAPARQVHLDLCLVFRRAVVAACCGAIEAREELREARSGIPGEVSATHTLQKWAAEHRRAAVISVSLSNRDSRSYVAASDLQQLPLICADRFREIVRPVDLVFAGREGEWLVLIPDVDSRVQPSLAATRILQAFEEPIQMPSGHPLGLSVAIGAALMPDHGREASAVIHSARLARWSLTREEGNFAWFRPEQGIEWQDYAVFMDELRLALESERMTLFLQPQVDLATRQCIGAELLLRWRREDGAWVEPPRIIETVVQNGWRQVFTEWLVRAAMRVAADLTDARIGVRLSMNLIAQDLLDPDLPDLLEQQLGAWNLPPERFLLELTETSMMGDQEKSLAAINRLNGMGFKLSLDDFGTGYSSLSYLARLPIHELKVDRSFVIQMFNGDQNMRIVRTILDLAHDLGMESLAEGIDDERQAQMLLQLGCRNGQGYLFAKPLPLEDFVLWFRGQRKVAA